MRILHFARADVIGGAAKAAYRLHGALRDSGHESRLVVFERASDDPDVLAAPRRHWAVRWRRATRNAPWRKNRRDARMNTDRAPEVDFPRMLRGLPASADVLCVHSIWHLLTTRGIRRLADHYRCPVVRVVMDQEAVTGGCHYSFGCDGYTRQCGCCPEIGSDRPNDISRALWLRKRASLADLPLTFVAPTQLTEEWVRRSSLFGAHRVERIALAIDTTLFRPADPCAVRATLGVPSNKKVLFFGSASLKEPRKGMAYLAEALHHLAARVTGPGSAVAASDVFLLIAGSEGEEIVSALPFARHAMGYLHQEQGLVSAYQAADVFVCPSVEDAGPMMIPEAMLCGTPVVAFNSGGAPDLVTTDQTGYLAAYKDSRDLAEGLYRMLSTDRLPTVRAAARQAALNRHEPALVAQRHLDLYRSLGAA